MQHTALITGASSGIGRDLARIHAEQGGDLIIVARRGEALEALKEELARAHGVSVRCVVADLTEPHAPQQLFDTLEAEKITVDLLINNAGFGGHGKFHERDWEADAAMIQLNVHALCALTRLFLPGMVARGRGRVLNVASTAAFLPGPLQAVYFATKAFVLSFSQAIAEELSDTPVTVTALCPGAVATEFSATAGLDDVPAFRFTATSESVARIGYRATMAGKLVAINDWKLRLALGWVLPLLPRRLVLKLSRSAMEKA
jgi:short-subunit dehydrogenase